MRGYNTRYFWVNAVTIALVGLTALAGSTPLGKASLVAAALAAVFSLKRGFEKLKDGADRPVWKTTEFWQSIVVAAVAGVSVLKDSMPDTNFTYVLGILGTGLAISQYIAAQNNGGIDDGKVPDVVVEDDNVDSPVVEPDPGDSNLPIVNPI